MQEVNCKQNDLKSDGANYQLRLSEVEILCRNILVHFFYQLLLHRQMMSLCKKLLENIANTFVWYEQFFYKLVIIEIISACDVKKKACSSIIIKILHEERLIERNCQLPC